MIEQDDYKNILKQIKKIEKQFEIIEQFVKNCITINKYFIENKISMFIQMPYHTKEKKTIKKKTKKGSNGLTEKQKEKLKEHKKHHTTKHITIMKRMMKKGTSFSKAHNIAKKMVGK